MIKLSESANTDVRVRIVRVPVVDVGTVRVKVAAVDKVTVGRTLLYLFPSVKVFLVAVPKLGHPH